VPLFNELTSRASRGIRVSNTILKAYKSQLKGRFYRQLKAFAETHNVLYEIPSNEGDIRDKLNEMGYETDQYSVDFILDFLPTANGYAENLRALQKLHKNFRIFNSISASAKRVAPLVESHGTSTSRIYF